VKEVIVQNILESMSIGLMVVDSSGKIVVTNAAAASNLGYTQEELRRKGWAELFLETRENEQFNQLLVDVVMNKSVNLHRKVPYVKPSGQELKFSITSSFIRDDQETLGIVVLIDDITVLEKLHEKEKSALEERARLQQERVESLNLFAMSVAHQLRNPLMSMGGFANRILKNTDPQQPHTAYLETILSGIKRLQTIVRAVEDYSSIVHLEKKLVLLDEIIEQVRSDLDTKATELKKSIDWSIRLSVKNVFLDGRRFAQALTELLLNALESFLGEQGRIEIVAEERNRLLHLEIKDSGSGINEKDKPFIFDPFFTTKAVGVGMGLCKAQRIVAEHQGSMHIESEAGTGTKAGIILPMDLDGGG